MRKMGIWMAVVVTVGVLVSAQQPARTRAVLITNDGTLHLQAWRAGPSGYESFWEATPRAADIDLAARRGEVVVPARDAPPVIVDVDRDGSNDLLVMDTLGLTVYGKTPAYLPFDTAMVSVAPVALATADVDGDGAVEFVTMRVAAAGREVEVWKPGGATLQRLWGQQIPGASGLVLQGDVDRDRQHELVAWSSDNLRSVQIIRPGKASSSATLGDAGGTPIAGRIVDVDADGAGDLIVGSNGGKVTVYGHRREGASPAFDILWQSPALIAEGAAAPGGQPQRAFVTAVEVGDVDGDGGAEIVAASYEVARPPAQGPPGRIHVFKRSPGGGFASAWVSDWTQAPRTAGLAIGDLTGDGVNEVVYNGRDIYGFDPTTKGFRLQGTLGGTARDAVVGGLGELREPTAATRVVPLYWTLANRAIASGQTAEVALTLLNVWAPARDVRVNVASGSPTLQAEGSVTVPAAIATGSTAVAPKFTAAVKGDQTPVVLKLEIAAAGGYRQTVPVELRVTPPLPTYDAANVEARIAAASAHAKEENRRVLVAWGSNADKASQALIELTVRNSEVSQKLLYEYDLVRADPAGNEAVAAKLGADVKGATLPRLTVLDTEGKVLANEAAGTFKASAPTSSVFDPKALVTFLSKHQAPYLDAEPLLAAALSRAKKDQKALFLWFSAPW